MSNPLRTPEDYELFLYSLLAQFPAIRGSTLTFVRRGASLARVAGELSFDHEIRLVVRQRIVYDRFPAKIDSYGYEVWQGGQKQYWYDAQPHPDDLSLQSTHPHHKHLPPDIKHNRVPAPGMSFSQPNLPLLIREVELLVQQLEGERLGRGQ
jgi:hypothetical protein